jgi:hypothetical protein
MKASSSMRVEIAIANALSARILMAATFDEAQADLETLRALHVRTPSDALPLALSHLVEFLDKDDPERMRLVEEGQLALEKARARQQLRHTSETTQPYVFPPTEYKQVPRRSSALVLDSEADWHLPPAFSGDWMDLPAMDAEEAVDQVRSAFPAAWNEGVAEGVRAVRRMHMSCYPGFDAVEVLFQFEDQPKVSQLVLLGSKTALWITGSSVGIHELNLLNDENGKPYLDISTDDKAAEYLRFFCGGVHGTEGPFRVIENVAELRAHMKPGADYEVLEDVLVAAPMTRVQGEANEPGWKADMTVLYARGLFRATFHIHTSGMIEMVQDIVLMQDLPAIWQVMGRGLRQVRGSV